MAWFTPQQLSDIEKLKNLSDAIKNDPHFQYRKGLDDATKTDPYFFYRKVRDFPITP